METHLPKGAQRYNYFEKQQTFLSKSFAKKD